MTKDTKKTQMFLFAILLTLAAIVNAAVLIVEDAPLYQMLTSIGLVITAGFGAIYLFTGFSKEKSAGYFSCFMAMYTLTEWMGIIGAKSNNTINMLLLVLSFGCAFTLTIAKDLGQVKSYVLSSIIILTVIARLIISYFTTGLPVFGIRPLTKLILGITVLVLVSAKYYDKNKRYAEAEISSAHQIKY